MATMVPGDIEEFETGEEKAFYPGSGKPQPLAGMSPCLGVSQVPSRFLAGWGSTSSSRGWPSQVGLVGY